MTVPPRLELPSVFKDTGWVLFGQVSGRGTIFLGGAAIATTLGAATFADFSYLVLTSAALTTASSIGSGMAITRYVATRAAGVANEDASKVLAALLLGLLGGAATLLLVGSLPSLFFPKAVMYLKMPIMITLAVQLASALTSSILIGEGQFASIAIANLVSGVSLLLIVAISALNKSRQLVIWAIPLSQFAFLLLTTRATLQFIALDFKATKPALAISAIPSVMRFALPMFVTSLLAITGPWAIGILLLGIDKAEFAAYSAGLQWFSLILVVPGALTNAYLPRIFRDHARIGAGALQRPELTISRNAKQALVIAAAGAVVVLVLGDLLIRFHGQVLQGHKDVFAAFVIAAVILAPTNPLGNGLAALNGQTTWMVLTGAWWVALVGVGFFYPVTTALSAGLDMCLAYAILLLLSFAVTRQMRTRGCQRRNEDTSLRIGE